MCLISSQLCIFASLTCTLYLAFNYPQLRVCVCAPEWELVAVCV